MSAIHSRPRIRERGPSPLSGRTRRRLLSSLMRRADAGDTQAAESLIRLGLDQDLARRANPAPAEAAATG